MSFLKTTQTKKEREKVEIQIKGSNDEIMDLIKKLMISPLPILEDGKHNFGLPNPIILPKE